MVPACDDRLTLGLPRPFCFSGQGEDGRVTLRTIEDNAESQLLLNESNCTEGCRIWQGLFGRIGASKQKENSHLKWEFCGDGGNRTRVRKVRLRIPTSLVDFWVSRNPAQSTELIAHSRVRADPYIFDNRYRRGDYRTPTWFRPARALWGRTRVDVAELVCERAS